MANVIFAVYFLRNEMEGEKSGIVSKHLIFYAWLTDFYPSWLRSQGSGGKAKLRSKKEEARQLWIHSQLSRVALRLLAGNASPARTRASRRSQFLDCQLKKSNRSIARYLGR